LPGAPGRAVVDAAGAVAVDGLHEHPAADAQGEFAVAGPHAVEVPHPAPPVRPTRAVEGGVNMQETPIGAGPYKLESLVYAALD